MTASHRPWAAPRLFDPAMALVERIDRWRRHVEAVRREGILGLERDRHRGAAITLSDGTPVPRGASIWTVHFDNARLRQLAARGWQTRAYAVAAGDLHAIAARVGQLPAAERPVALHGVTLLAPLTRRVGFEQRDRERTARVRLEDWYLRSLLARWSPLGRGRLVRGHGDLHTREVWLATGELLRRYGEPPPL
jgi:hypothetical protein